MANPFRGALRKSFLERNQKIIGIIGILAVLGGSAFALLLSGGVFSHTYRVTAYFTDAASIASGDNVTVAGLDAGTVKSIDIRNGRVAMTLAVDSGVRLTADTRATVRIETLLGRKSVELIDGRSSRPLQDGAVIPVDRTTTPVDITQLNDISVRLLDRSDAGALNTFLAEVTKVTGGKATQVRQLVTGLSSLSQAIDARRTQLEGLITSLNTLSTTLGDNSDVIVSAIDNLNPILANLAARESDIQQLLVSTDSATHSTADLVKRDRAVLDKTLTSLHTTLQVLDAHQVDLAATVSYLEQSVQGYQSVGYSQGNCGVSTSTNCNEGVPNQWANIFVQSLGPAGVDALLGQCGAVDQFIDAILSLDCQNPTKPPHGTKRGGGGLGGIGGIGGSGGSGGSGSGGKGGVGPVPIPSLPIPKPGRSGGPLPLPSLPFGLSARSGGAEQAHTTDAWISAGLPGTIGDLVDFALQGTNVRIR